MARINSSGVIEIYDVATDESRPITVDDVSRMETVIQAFGRWREASRWLDDLALAAAQGKVDIADFDKRTEKLKATN